MLLWPFKAIWKLSGLIFDLVGNLLTILIGLILILVGIIFATTLLGATIGVPMIIFGITLVLRGLF